MRTASMDVRAIASLRVYARVGFVVPKYKHSSVDRNRLKRRLRELVRLELLPTLRPMDLVLRVNPVAYRRDFDQLRAEVHQAARQLATVTLPTATGLAAAGATGAPTSPPNAASSPASDKLTGDTPPATPT